MEMKGSYVALLLSLAVIMTGWNIFLATRDTEMFRVMDERNGLIRNVQQ